MSGAALVTPHTVDRGSGPRFDVARRLLRSQTGALATVLLVLLIGGAFLIPPILGIDPLAQTRGARLLSPSWSHLFGTDEAGRDLFVRSMVGLQVSLQVAVVSAGLSALVGSLIGFVVGYAAGVIDTAAMRIVDVLLAFPDILMALVVITIFGSSLWSVSLALALASSPFFTRLARAVALAERQREYVVAAQAVGAGPMRIIFRHVLVNSLSPLILQVTLTMGFAVLGEASLSFLGLGIQPPSPSLGNILRAGQTFLFSGATYYVVLPALLLAVLMFAMSLFADALNDAIASRKY